jgi:hypothetical protein
MLHSNIAKMVNSICFIVRSYLLVHYLIAKITLLFESCTILGDFFQLYDIAPAGGGGFRYESTEVPDPFVFLYQKLPTYPLTHFGHLGFLDCNFEGLMRVNLF